MFEITKKILTELTVPSKTSKAEQNEAKVKNMFKNDNPPNPLFFFN